MQWLVMQWFLPKAWLWVVATVFGSVLGWVCSLGLFIVAGWFGNIASIFFPTWFPEGIVCGVVAGAGGIGIGVSQWLYLRNYVRRAGWWVVGSAIALGIGAGPNLCAGLNMYGDRNWFALLAIGGLVGGAIKGGTLVWLLRGQKISVPPSTPTQERLTNE